VKQRAEAKTKMRARVRGLVFGDCGGDREEWASEDWVCWEGIEEVEEVDTTKGLLAFIIGNLPKPRQSTIR
jgi:hypothetical protein